MSTPNFRPRKNLTISLDRDSVSKEFQSRIVLGKKEYYIHQYEQLEQ